MRPELEKDLQYRLSLVGPQDTVRGLMFNGVLDAVRELAGEDAVRECLEAAGETGFVEFFNYPSSVQLRLIYKAAELLEGRCGGFEKTLWTMGYRGAQRFLGSAPGKVLLVGLLPGNPRRLLAGLPIAFSVGASSIAPEMRRTGPKTAVFVLKRDFLPPAYTEGVLQATFEAAKTKGFQVRSRHVEQFVWEYDLSWE